MIFTKFIKEFSKGFTFQNFAKKKLGGFTLIELLIVLAILSVLAGTVVLVLNPGEILAEGRDAKRIGELNSLAEGITFQFNSVVGGYKGEKNKVYISLSDSSSTCNSLTSLLPNLSVGWSYHCVSAENLKKTDGTGWLPISLNALPGGSPFNELPTDPKNLAAGNLFFAYVYGDAGYVLTSLLESESHRKDAEKDGGSDPNRYEIGSDLSLWANALGL
ncbi:MAG: prepilin-type N-terminal cleavage/methylation domain-containing protein [Parcubacteria group bacterium]